MLTDEQAQKLQAGNAALRAALERLKGRIARYCGLCRDLPRPDLRDCEHCPLTQMDVDAGAYDTAQERLALECATVAALGVKV